MENNKNIPPVFLAYVVGDAIPQGHVVYQNMVVPISIYNALQPGANPQVAVQPEPQRYCNFLFANFCGKRGQQPPKLVQKCF